MGRFQLGFRQHLTESEQNGDRLKQKCFNKMIFFTFDDFIMLLASYAFAKECKQTSHMYVEKVNRTTRYKA